MLYCNESFNIQSRSPYFRSKYRLSSRNFIFSVWTLLKFNKAVRSISEDYADSDFFANLFFSFLSEKNDENQTKNSNFAKIEGTVVAM